MPKPKKPRVPSYRRHKASGNAVVTLSGKDVYLGPYGSKESREAYDRVVGEWQTNGRQLPGPVDDLTVVELANRYRKHCEVRYVKNGEPSSHLDGIKMALQAVRRLYGHTPAADFGPLALKAVRDMMAAEVGPEGRRRFARTSVNKAVRLIRQMFKWAVGNELIPPSVLHGLQAVEAIRKGTGQAREAPPVKPVAETHVEAIRPFVSDQVWMMIELQRLTGMRPGEVVAIRTGDLETTGSVWVYRPGSHKTEHHDKTREVPIGPKAKEILQRRIKPDLAAYIFSPTEAETKRLAKRHAKRKTPLRYGNRPGTNRVRKAHRKRHPANRYDVASYRRAIARACDLAFPATGDLARGEKETADTWRARLAKAGRLGELKAWRDQHRWHPHQLRHNYATMVRREYGIETARILLGHSTMAASLIYAEADLARAREVAAKIG